MVNMLRQRMSGRDVTMLQILALLKVGVPCLAKGLTLR